MNLKHLFYLWKTAITRRGVPSSSAPAPAARFVEAAPA